MGVFSDLASAIIGDTITNITGNGFNIFYDPTLNAALLAGGNHGIYNLGSGGFLEPNASPVPVPPSALLLGTGLLGLVGLGWRRRKHEAVSYVIWPLSSRSIRGGSRCRWFDHNDHNRKITEGRPRVGKSRPGPAFNLFQGGSLTRFIHELFEILDNLLKYNSKFNNPEKQSVFAQAGKPGPPSSCCPANYPG